MKQVRLDGSGEGAKVVVTEEHHVVDPCFICGFPTEPGKRVEAGNPAGPTVYHKVCHSAEKYMTSQAKRQDTLESKAKSEVVTAAVDALKMMKEKERTKWVSMVLRCVLEEAERRGPADREMTAKLIEVAITFAACFRQTAVIMKPKRAFIQHFKLYFGYSQQEAEAEWNAAYANIAQVKRELNDKGEECLAISDFVRYIGQEGQRREAGVTRERDLDADGRAAAERRIAQGISLQDAALGRYSARLQGGHVPEREDEPTEEIGAGLGGFLDATFGDLCSGDGFPQQAAPSSAALATALPSLPSLLTVPGSGAVGGGMAEASPAPHATQIVPHTPLLARIPRTPLQSAVVSVSVMRATKELACSEYLFDVCFSGRASFNFLGKFIVSVFYCHKYMPCASSHRLIPIWAQLLVAIFCS